MAAASRDSSQHATDASTTVGASQAPIVRRCFYAACDRCSADVVERAEEHHQLSHVSLLGALHGERYGFPGGGEAPEFLVPAGKFLAEHILGKRLVKLIWTQEGWAPLQDEATGEPVLSPAPASAFVGGDNRPYVSGSLARIANEHGMVFVMFSDQQARGVTRTAWRDDVLREHAEEHSRDPLKSAGSLKKRARGTGASDENTPVTTPASKCQRRCLNMPALPHTLTAPPTPMPGVDSPFLCRCLIWGRTSWKGSVNLCWGPLKVKVMSGRPDLYILRCGHCNALYREADVSRLPRRYAYCSSTVDVLPRRRVRSISCPP